MAVDTDHLDMRQVGGQLIQRRCFIDIDAELVFLQAGGDVRVRLRIDIRVDANGDARHLVLLAGYQVEQFQLGSGFDIEAMDAGVQRHLHFLGGLADTGEHYLLRVATGTQHACQFAAGDDVEAGAEAREDVQDGNVGVGLDRVADLVRVVTESIDETLVVLFQRGARVDIQRCAKTFGQLGNRDILGMQFAVAVLEVVHVFYPLVV